MEAGEKCANICSSPGLAPATVLTVMANAEKIKLSPQKTTKLRALNVSYARNVNVEKMEQLLKSWVDNVNQKRVPLIHEDEEDRGTKEMQTKDLTDILYAVDMAAEKLCDIDPDWERSSAVKRGITAMLHPYCEILQEKTKKIKTVDVTLFLDVF